ncbi:MAG: flagellar hook-basal body complex protein FliE [Ilumatobacteraceae bacterium]|nr:flagellar hook-basal body complex protein FliE [Ilumatobacteraceae bacterium]
MAIGPIAPAAMTALTGLSPAAGASTAAPTTGAAEAGGNSFGDMVTDALDGLSASHENADQLAVKAATGDLNAVHDYTIAATEAQLMTQLTVEVRNRAIEAFNDIMRMQV